MKRTIKTSLGYSMFVASIERTDLPSHIIKNADSFQNYYVVRNVDENGSALFYLGKDGTVPQEICGWYAKHGEFWTSCGKTFKDAIEGMIADGWKYA